MFSVCLHLLHLYNLHAHVGQSDSWQGWSNNESATAVSLDSYGKEEKKDLDKYLGNPLVISFMFPLSDLVISQFGSHLFGSGIYISL